MSRATDLKLITDKLAWEISRVKLMGGEWSDENNQWSVKGIFWDKEENLLNLYSESYGETNCLWIIIGSPYLRLFIIYNLLI